MQQHSISSLLPQRAARLSTWHWIGSGVCSLVLLVLLVACSGTGGSANGSGGSGGSGGTASSTPITGGSGTGASATSTASVTVSTETNYTITYPQTWKKSGSGNNVIFHDTATSGNSLTVVVTPNPNGKITASQFATTSMQVFGKTLTNSKAVSMPATVTMNGTTWSQQAITGTTKVGAQNVQIKAVMLVTTHPTNAANTQTYEIIYVGPVFTFDLVNAINFQPMLQSFKFTS